MGLALAVSALSGCASGGHGGGSAWRAACKGDVARFCRGFHGYQAVIQCLSQVEGSVTPACHDALGLMRQKAEKGQIATEKNQY
jgi:hypothetical protein